MDITSEACLALVAVIVVFIISMAVAVGFRKRHMNKESPHHKKTIVAMWILIVLWLVAFIFMGWSWYWLIKNTRDSVKVMFNWLFGLSLLSILLWCVMFFVCDSLASSIVLITLLIILSVAIATQAGVIKNYWIMAFEIVFVIFLVIVSILSCLSYKMHCRSQGHNSMEVQHVTKVETKTTDTVEHKKKLSF
jgi:hypothetical protein